MKSPNRRLRVMLARKTAHSTLCIAHRGKEKPKAKSFGFYLRFVAAIVVLVFTTTTLAHSAPFLPTQIGNAPGGTKQTDANSMRDLYIPIEFGTVEESFIAKNCESKVGCKSQFMPDIFYIQDAHDSLEAQENIAKIVCHLVSTCNVKTVYVEGYEGKMPLEELFPLKDKKKKKQVAYFFMDHLRLGGAEYARLVHEEKFNVIGAENIRKYEKNLENYRQTFKTRETLINDLERISKYLKAIGERVYPREIKQYQKARELFDASKLSLADYICRLIKLYNASGTGHNVPLLLHGGKYPSFAVLADLMSKREVISKADRSELRDALKGINTKNILRELEEFENDFVVLLLKNPAANRNFVYQKNIELLKKLSLLSLSQTEYTKLRSMMNEHDNGFFNTKNIARFLSDNLNRTIIIRNEWEKLIHENLRFYKVARNRERAVVKRISNPCSKSTPCILVMGGFHAHGIKERLRASNISYITITPKITEKDIEHQKRYNFLMSGNYYKYEKIFNTRSSALKPDGLGYMKLKGFPVRKMVLAVASSVGKNGIINLGKVSLPASGKELSQPTGKSLGKDTLDNGPKSIGQSSDFIRGPPKPTGSSWLWNRILIGYVLITMLVVSILIPVYFYFYTNAYYVELVLTCSVVLWTIFSTMNFVYSVLTHILILFDVKAQTYRVESKLYSYKIPEGIFEQSLKTQTIMVPIYKECWAVVGPMLESSLEAIRRYNLVAGRRMANLLVCDDGLMYFSDNDPITFEEKVQLKQKQGEGLTEEENEFMNRMKFYRANNVAVVARPKDNSEFGWGIFKRRGYFKKASNLNHAHLLIEKIEHGIDEGLSYEQALQRAKGLGKNGKTIFANTFTAGRLEIGEIICLLDKDSIVPPNGLMHTVKEFILDPNLAYTQNGIYITNYEENWFTKLMSHHYEVAIKYLFPVEAHYGFARMFGHNAFIRRAALSLIGYWDENQVGEDTALSVMVSQVTNPESGKLYYGKFVQYESRAFSEWMKFENEQLDIELGKHGISRQEFETFEQKIRELFNQRKLEDYLTLYNIHKKVLRTFVQAEGSLSDRIIKSIMLHLENLQNFGEAMPESINADLPRKTKFAHGDTENLFNPIPEWKQKGILRPVLRGFLKEKRLPWFVKLHHFHFMMTAPMVLLPLFFMVQCVILYNVFGSDIFIRLRFVEAFWFFFWFGLAKMAFTILATTLRQDGLRKSLLTITKEFLRNYLITIFKVVLFRGIGLYSTIGATKYLLGKAGTFPPTPIFKDSTSSIRKILGRIAKGKKSIFTLAGALIIFTLLGFFNKLEFNQVTILLSLPGIVSSLFGILGCFIYEPALHAAILNKIRSLMTKLTVRGRTESGSSDGMRRNEPPEQAAIEPLGVISADTLLEPARAFIGLGRLRNEHDGKSLGVVANHPNVISILSEIETPIPVFIDFNDYKVFSEEQKNEVFLLASENKITVTIYNDSDSEFYELEKGIRNAGNLRKGILSFRGNEKNLLEIYGKKHKGKIIHLSRFADARKYFSQSRFYLFRQTGLKRGTLAAALLYQLADGNIKGIIRDKDGFLILDPVSRLAALVEEYEAYFVVEKAA